MNKLIRVLLIMVSAQGLCAQGAEVEVVKQQDQLAMFNSAEAEVAPKEFYLNKTLNITENKEISPDLSGFEVLKLGPKAKFVIADGVTVLVKGITIEEFDFKKIELQGKESLIIFEDVVIVLQSGKSKVSLMAPGMAFKNCAVSFVRH